MSWNVVGVSIVSMRERLMDLCAFVLTFSYRWKATNHRLSTTTYTGWRIGFKVDSATTKDQWERRNCLKTFYGLFALTKLVTCLQIFTLTTLYYFFLLPSTFHRHNNVQLYTQQIHCNVKEKEFEDQTQGKISFSFSCSKKTTQSENFNIQW